MSKDPTFLERIGRYCRKTQWPTLIIGGVLAAGGVSWCTSPNFKDNSSEWTTRVAFIVGSVGLSLVYSSLYDARRNRIVASALEPILPQTRRLELPVPDGLADTDSYLFGEVNHKITFIDELLEASERKCDSCLDTIEKFYNALLQFTEDMDTNESQTRLFDLIEKISTDYKSEHGYPHEKIKYDDVIPYSFGELKGQIFSLLENIMVEVRDIIAYTYRGEEKTILKLSDACIDEFISCPDVSEEHRKEISRMVEVVAVKFQRTLHCDMEELEEDVKNRKEPALKRCETVRILMEMLGYNLFP